MSVTRERFKEIGFRYGCSAHLMRYIWETEPLLGARHVSGVSEEALHFTFGIMSNIGSLKSLEEEARRNLEEEDSS